MKMISICLDQHKNIFLREIVLVLAAIWWRIDSQTHESELLLAFCCLRWNTSPNTHSVLYHVWQVNLRVLSIQSEFCEIICFLFLLCFLLSSYCLQSASRFSLSLSSCYTYFLMILQLFLPPSLSSCISFLFLPMHCFTGVPYLLVQAVPVVTQWALRLMNTPALEGRALCTLTLLGPGIYGRSWSDLMVKENAKISKEGEKAIFSAENPPLSCFYLILMILYACTSVSAVFDPCLWNTASPNLKAEKTLQSNLLALWQTSTSLSFTYK